MSDLAVLPEETFKPVRIVASMLGVPAAWLKSEVEAGRVPHLRAGPRILLNPEAVERVLLERANQAARQEGGDV